LINVIDKNTLEMYMSITCTRYVSRNKRQELWRDKSRTPWNRNRGTRLWTCAV